MLDQIAATLLYVFFQPIAVTAGVVWAIGLFFILLRSIVRMTQIGDQS
jgi:hypothetical protein